MKGRHRTLTRQGLTLIEMLISMAITASLLIAIAAAFHASAIAVETNERYFRCTQSARVALEQISAELRRADAAEVTPGGQSLRIIRPIDQLAPGEIYRQYAYEPSTQRITLQIVYAGNNPSPTYNLAENVSACTFGPAEMGSDPQGKPVTRCVPLHITCSLGTSSVTLTGAASPRRARAL
jgi:prepilin-type N-terminal cleavage/methylation domain-containing protein